MVPILVVCPVNMASSVVRVSNRSLISALSCCICCRLLTYDALITLKSTVSLKLALVNNVLIFVILSSSVFTLAVKSDTPF